MRASARRRQNEVGDIGLILEVEIEPGKDRGPARDPSSREIVVSTQSPGDMASASTPQTPCPPLERLDDPDPQSVTGQQQHRQHGASMEKTGNQESTRRIAS